PVLLAAARGAGFGREAVPAGTGWVWLVVLLAIAVVPPSLVAACVEGEGTAPAWPWRLPALLRGLGRDLTPLMVATAAAALFEVVDGAMEPFSGEDTKLDLHIVQAFLPRWASLEALAGLAILAGALVRTRATELGHGDPAADLVARLQEPPAGRWTPPAPDPEVVAAEQARRYAPIELADPRDVIREAVARKDVDAALVPLKGGHVAPDAVDADVLIELAQLMGGRGQFAEAAQVLRGVAVRPRGPQTARALVILARLCVERLGDVDEGRALYRRVVADFPGTPAAEFARAQLAADGE
ncbi:MAG: tetratricopeptide repeat protein, partial [Myxococcota bacterium]